MALNEFKTLVDTLQAIITTLAIIIGGIWALRRYVFQREGFPRIEFFVDANFVGVHQDEWLVEFLGMLKNEGNVPHRIKRFDFSVRALLDSDRLEDGEQVRGQVLFPHVIKKGSWIPGDKDVPMVLMPSVSFRYSYQYHVPLSASFLLIQGRLYYEGHEHLEHRADKVVKIPPRDAAGAGLPAQLSV